MAGSNTGDKLYFSTGLPATEDTAGYAALTWVLADAINIGEIGDTPGEATVNPLNGRKRYYIAGLDGGKIPFKIENVPLDAAQVIILAGMNSDIDHSVKVVTAQGELFNFFGKLANMKYTAREDGGTDDITFEVWVNSKVI